jgi:hypothetical protein
MPAFTKTGPRPDKRYLASVETLNPRNAAASRGFKRGSSIFFAPSSGLQEVPEAPSGWMETPKFGMAHEYSGAANYSAVIPSLGRVETT